jgi:hypothetical protein
LNGLHGDTGVSGEVFFPQVDVDLPPRRLLDRLGDTAVALIVERTAKAMAGRNLRNEASMYRQGVTGIDTVEGMLTATARWVTPVFAERAVPRGSVRLPARSLLVDIGDDAMAFVLERATASIRHVDASLVDAFIGDARRAPDLGRLLEVLDEWIETSETEQVVPAATAESPPSQVCERIGDRVGPIVAERVAEALRSGGHSTELAMFERFVATSPWGADAVDRARRWVVVDEGRLVAPDVAVELPDDSVLYSTTVDGRSLLRERVHRALRSAGRHAEAAAFLDESDTWASGSGPLPAEVMAQIGEWVHLGDGPPMATSATTKSQKVPNSGSGSGPTTTWRTGPTNGATPVGAATRAHAVAATVEVVMWILLVIGVIGGIVIAAQQQPLCDYGADCSFTDEYPLFGVGIGIAIGCAINCLMVIMVATYIRARASRAIP